MNIDTLKTSSGAYFPARHRDIVRMLGAEHATHIQTGRGTIAIRPGSRTQDGREVKGWTVDRAVSGITNRSQSKFFTRQEQRRVIKVALLFLNGKHHFWRATDYVQWWANQAQRDGRVLAVNGNEVLIEYEMPAGTSALVLCDGLGETLRAKRTIPHCKLSREWIDCIHEQGAAAYWIGHGQRMQRAIDLPAHS